ncbi:MAG: nucleotidyltransferase domain-containing protein [Methanomassiliicoccaceae archaeon]|nr:nucleotidyltransferase domain-containing protein [Methanomassiliicoccaceae archaeon]
MRPIAEEYGVDKVYLFGSAARGDDKENSDYDFRIERGKIRDLFTLAGFFGDLKDAIGHEIDLVTTKSLPPEFLNDVMRDRMILYE